MSLALQSFDVSKAPGMTANKEMRTYLGKSLACVSLPELIWDYKLRSNYIDRLQIELQKKPTTWKWSSGKIDNVEPPQCVIFPHLH